ncbi:YhgE/Pip domain-containing protein [Ligilactobacillus agilis]|uniref:YhgE/Pip domain-containing protein n=1 Tax=Ligilactobacillus agilis TaxID=1601 RepID=UPI00255C8958|nr:YhgE/Pip domain-containing protein [Ligilactobacillus agilis]
MIIEEFKNLKRHKILIATILGIMSLPFLYSLFFLKSVWDPYGSTSYLPVAVVNKDQATYYQGKKFQVGHDLVSKLKDNDDLEWHFVSEKEANDGLSHKKYYMVITIPKNFSKNATTVLNRHPHKMNLTYETNDSLNYIGKVISETGVKQVNSEIRESVSTAYADTMFKVVKKVGKGFNEAASGSKQLADGSKVLNDGLNTYTAGVGQVNNGVIQLAAGVVPLSDGVQKLTAGSTALATGLKTYTAGVSQVNDGVQTLNSSTGTLATGVNALATGSNTLKDGIGQYTAGVSQVNAGVGELQAKTPTLANGVGKLAAGSKEFNTKLAQYTNGVDKLNAGLSQIPAKDLTSLKQLPAAAAALYQLNYIMSASIDAGLKQIDQQSLNALLTGVGQVDTQKLATSLTVMNSLMGQMESLQTTANQMQSGLPAMEQAINKNQQAIAASLGKIATYNGTNQKLADAVTGDVNAVLASPNSTLSEADKAKLQDAIKNTATIKTNSTNSLTEVGVVGNNLTQLKGTLDKTLASLGELKTQMADLQKQASSLDVKGLQSQLALLTKMQGALDKDKLAKLQTTLGQLQQLQTAAAKASSIAQELNSGINGQGLSSSDQAKLMQTAQVSSDATTALVAQNTAKLAGPSTEKFTTLVAGLAELSSGAKELSSNNGALLAGSNQIATGLGTLNDSIPALTNGVTKLANGTNQLASKNAELNSGASQLAGGLGTLNANVPALTSGVSQLASGTSQLVANNGQLNSGASQLAGGLGTLNAQIPTMTNGVNQLASGTGQLAANSSALTAGSDKIYKGNKKLAKSMKQGANTIKKVKTGKDNAKMFAAPSDLVEKHYSYVPNYGYALAPYMLSVALFVGAMVFNLVYPIRRLESEDETAFEWFMAKVTIGSIVAIGNALVEALLMVAVGLHPDHLGAMLANGILFSLAMMFLIMFFSVAFQNPGRFLCMILLVIQLGASGGSFPIEITKGLGGFFQAVNPYLPMTYSIYGFRQALTSGLGASQMIISYSVSLLFLVISLGLLYVAMVVVRPNVEYVEEVDINNYTKQN